MPSRPRRVLGAAALVAALALPGLGEETTGTVLPPQVQNLVYQAQTVSSDAMGVEPVLLTIDPNEPASGGVRTYVAGVLEGALAALAALEGAAADLELPEDAFQDVRDSLNRALDALEREQDSSVVLGHAKVAGGYASTLAFTIAGIKTGKGDAAAIAANPDLPTVAVDGDLKHFRKIFKFRPEDLLSGRASTVLALARCVKQKFPKYKYNGLTVAGGGFNPPANYYFSFTGKGGEAGSCHRTLDLPLVGPFEVRFQVGTWVSTDDADTGYAFVSFGLPVEGQPYLRVRGRRVDGGVEVSAVSHLGGAGTAFLPGARIAQVRVSYAGGQFTCAAAEGAGAPDFVMATFATQALAQGETPFAPSLGAEGLLQGGTIALDEVFFTPL